MAPPTMRASRAARSQVYEDTAGIWITTSRLPSWVRTLLIDMPEISSSSEASAEYIRSHDTAPSSDGKVMSAKRPSAMPRGSGEIPGV